MNDLAERVANVHPSQDYFTCTHEEREQIIAALRRGFDLKAAYFEGYEDAMKDRHGT